MNRDLRLHRGSEAPEWGDFTPAVEGGSRSTLYLHPGRLFVSSEAIAASTILGSCVSVCLWDPLLRNGGANHFLLPYHGRHDPSAARFGNLATQQLIDQLVGLGSQKRNLQAKMFGGACVIEAFRGRGRHLGEKNIDAARAVLAENGIPIVAEDVGGHRGRKLIFHTDTGTALVRLV
jgi:chemotaxis protein CheD